MVRVQMQDVAPLKGRHGRRGEGRTVVEGSPCHSSAVGGSSLDRSPNGGRGSSGSAPPPRERWSLQRQTAVGVVPRCCWSHPASSTECNIAWEWWALWMHNVKAKSLHWPSYDFLYSRNTIWQTLQLQRCSKHLILTHMLLNFYICKLEVQGQMLPRQQERRGSFSGPAARLSRSWCKPSAGEDLRDHTSHPRYSLSSSSAFFPSCSRSRCGKPLLPWLLIPTGRWNGGDGSIPGLTHLTVDSRSYPPRVDICHLQAGCDAYHCYRPIPRMISGKGNPRKVQNSSYTVLLSGEFAMAWWKGICSKLFVKKIWNCFCKNNFTFAWSCQLLNSLKAIISQIQLPVLIDCCPQYFLDTFCALQVTARHTSV